MKAVILALAFGLTAPAWSKEAETIDGCVRPPEPTCAPEGVSFADAGAALACMGEVQDFAQAIRVYTNCRAAALRAEANADGDLTRALVRRVREGTPR